VGGANEELCILASWFLSLMSKNLVLKKLIVKRLAVANNRPVEERFEGEKCLSQS